VELTGVGGKFPLNQKEPRFVCPLPTARSDKEGKWELSGCNFGAEPPGDQGSVPGEFGTSVSKGTLCSAGTAKKKKNGRGEGI